MEFVLDPVFQAISRLLLVLLFASAAWHKMRDKATFISVLDVYDVNPKAWNPPLSRLIIFAEMMVVTLLLTWPTTGGLMALVLLCFYTALIAYQLYQGKRDMDCGCSGPGVKQILSAWLLLRNGCLILLAVLLLLPVTDRVLSWMDASTILFAVVSLTLVYLAVERLLANSAFMDHALMGNANE